MSYSDADKKAANLDDFSADTAKRNLQLEAKAHMVVQKWIDQGGLGGSATTSEAICEIHKRFDELLPAALLKVVEPDTGEEITVIPGQLRKRDVKVGSHIPVSPGAVPRYNGQSECFR